MTTGYAHRQIPDGAGLLTDRSVNHTLPSAVLEIMNASSPRNGWPANVP